MIFFVVLQLALIVLAHELGHYFFARLAGVRVLSFNIGFGPMVWSLERGGTRYALRLLPLGGFVQLGGLDGAVPAKFSYEHKSLPARFGIILGGALGNFLFAWLIACAVLAFLLKWNFLAVLYVSFSFFADLLQNIFQGIISLFVSRSLANVSGIAGIVNFAALSVKEGALSFWWIVAILSFNLGVFNLLPFPGLDGGRLVFLLYELLLRRKPNPALERWLTALGFVLLFWLMIIVNVQDLLNLKQ